MIFIIFIYMILVYKKTQNAIKLEAEKFNMILFESKYNKLFLVV